MDPAQVCYVAEETHLENCVTAVGLSCVCRGLLIKTLPTAPLSHAFPSSLCLEGSAYPDCSQTCTELEPGS